MVSKNCLLAYSVIEAATSGDIDAINTVIKHCSIDR